MDYEKNTHITDSPALLNTVSLSPLLKQPADTICDPAAMQAFVHLKLPLTDTKLWKTTNKKLILLNSNEDKSESVSLA